MDSDTTLKIEEQEDTRVCENVARLLEVSSAQIEMAMRDGSKAFDSLSQLSTDIFRLISALEEKAGNLNEEVDVLLRDLDNKRSDALGAFQFFDLLSQRVEHGVNSVSQLSQYLKGKEIDVADECWGEFKESITARFSLDQEKRLFELMMAGSSREDALRRIEELYASDNRVSVEFF